MGGLVWENTHLTPHLRPLWRGGGVSEFQSFSEEKKQFFYASPKCMEYSNTFIVHRPDFLLPSLLRLLWNVLVDLSITICRDRDVKFTLWISIWKFSTQETIFSCRHHFALEVIDWNGVVWKTPGLYQMGAIAASRWLALLYTYEKLLLRWVSWSVALLNLDTKTVF